MEELRCASEEECIQALQANETHRAKWNLELWELLDAALKEADPLRVEEIYETLRAEGYFELPKLSVIPLTVVEEEAPSVIELRDELADNETQMVALEDEHDRLLTSHGMERCDRCGLPRPPDTPFPGRNCPSCGTPPSAVALAPLSTSRFFAAYHVAFDGKTLCGRFVSFEDGEPVQPGQFVPLLPVCRRCHQFWPDPVLRLLPSQEHSAG